MATPHQTFSIPDAFALALKHYQDNHLPQAENLLRQILQATPKNAPALHLLGVIAHQSGNTPLGAQFVQQAVEFAPNEALFHSNLGEMYRLLKRLDEAIHHGESATRLAPNLASAHSNLGIAYYDQGELDKAQACQETALKLNPDLPPALNNLGSILREKMTRQAVLKREFSPCLGYLADTNTSKGLGVFACRDIEVDEIVEVAPVIEIRGEYGKLQEQLRSRVFHWTRLAGKSGVHAVALGYGSMYNHANPANLRYSACNGGTAIAFLAASNIRSGEELTINYNNTGGDAMSKEDNWFSTTGITPYHHDEDKNHP